MSVAAQVLDLAAGRDHSLVLRSGAQLVGWGGDGTGRFPAPLGVCSAPSSESGAVYVPTDVELRHITASAGMSLALDAQGELRVGLLERKRGTHGSHPATI